MQGRPTEAVKELKVLGYGQTDARSYVAGAEAIPEQEAKKEQDEQDQGKQKLSSNIYVTVNKRERTLK